MKRKRILAVALAFLLTACGSSTKNAPETTEIDSSHAEALAKATIETLNAKDADGLKAILDETMKGALTDEMLEKIFEDVAAFGAFEKLGAMQTADTTDKSGKTYTVVVAEAIYAEKKAVYTLSYDKDDKLAGLYYK